MLGDDDDDDDDDDKNDDKNDDDENDDDNDDDDENDDNHTLWLNFPLLDPSNSARFLCVVAHLCNNWLFGTPWFQV